MSEPVEIDVHAVAQLYRKGEPFLWIDCREPEEWEIARIEGSQLIPMGEIERHLPQFIGHQEQRVIVHCHHGRRSLWVVQMLRQAGLTRAQSMAGGIEAWSREIDPNVPTY